MSQGIKEAIKFGIFLIFGLAVVVLACFFIHPLEPALRLDREAAIVRSQVKGAEVKSALVIKNDNQTMQIYWAKPDVAVVFVWIELYERTTELVVCLDKNRIISIADATPGLAPYNSRLGRTLAEISAGLVGQASSADPIVAMPALDVMGGATIDYTRLASGLDQLVKTVRKAGNK